MIANWHHGGGQPGMRTALGLPTPTGRAESVARGVDREGLVGAEVPTLAPVTGRAIPGYLIGGEQDCSPAVVAHLSGREVHSCWA